MPIINRIADFYAEMTEWRHRIRFIFIFQPAEENEGGARLMIDKAVRNGLQTITSRNLHPLEGAVV